MTLHAVIGEGSINKRDLTHQLEDLREKATAEDDQFWFLVQGKSDPTQADKDLIAYFAENEIFFATIAHEDTTLDDLYENAEDNHEFDGEFGPALVEAMQSLQEDDEGADLLALLVNPKEDDEGDIAAIEAIQAAIDAGFEAFGLNDSMEQITLEEAEPEPPKAAAKKSSSSKATAEPKEGLLKDDEIAQPFNREELEAMSPPDIKALATGMGITGRGKKDYIEGILAARGDSPVSNVVPINSNAAAANGAEIKAGWLGEDQVFIVIHGASGVQFKRANAAAVDAL